MFMEQAANLHIIASDLGQQSELRDELEEAIQEYTAVNGRLINQTKGEKQIESVNTAMSLLEKTSHV